MENEDHPPALPAGMPPTFETSASSATVYPDVVAQLLLLDDDAVSQPPQPRHDGVCDREPAIPSASHSAAPSRMPERRHGRAAAPSPDDVDMLVGMSADDEGGSRLTDDDTDYPRRDSLEDGGGWAPAPASPSPPAAGPAAPTVATVAAGGAGEAGEAVVFARPSVARRSRLADWVAHVVAVAETGAPARGWALGAAAATATDVTHGVNGEDGGEDNNNCSNRGDGGRVGRKRWRCNLCFERLPTFDEASEHEAWCGAGSVMEHLCMVEEDAAARKKKAAAKYQCKVPGCAKFRQKDNDGMCRRHYNESLAPAQAKDIYAATDKNKGPCTKKKCKVLSAAHISHRGWSKDDDRILEGAVRAWLEQRSGGGAGEALTALYKRLAQESFTGRTPCAVQLRFLSFRKRIEREEEEGHDPKKKLRTPKCKGALPGGDQWECHSCTLMNDAEKKRCSCCRAWKGGKRRGSRPTTLSAKSNTKSDAVEEERTAKRKNLEQEAWTAKKRAEEDEASARAPRKARKCKVRGCGKNSQSNNDGMCRRHYNESLALTHAKDPSKPSEEGEDGAALLAESLAQDRAAKRKRLEEEESTGTTKLCKVSGCKKWGQHSKDGMCFRHYKEWHYNESQSKSDLGPSEQQGGEYTPSLVGKGVINSERRSAEVPSTKVPIQNQCRVPGCEKWQQCKNDGMCRKHYTESLAKVMGCDPSGERDGEGGTTAISKSTSSGDSKMNSQCPASCQVLSSAGAAAGTSGADAMNESGSKLAPWEVQDFLASETPQRSLLLQHSKERCEKYHRHDSGGNRRMHVTEPEPAKEHNLFEMQDGGDSTTFQLSTEEGASMTSKSATDSKKAAVDPAKNVGNEGDSTTYQMPTQKVSSSESKSVAEPKKAAEPAKCADEDDTSAIVPVVPADEKPSFSDICNLVCTTTTTITDEENDESNTESREKFEGINFMGLGALPWGVSTTEAICGVLR